jgi:phosphoglycolate phosphatase-like HAD superfamily hydrolase
MNRTAEKYLTFTFDKDETYVKKDKAELLKDVDAVIFDCDGVLIDIRESYDMAISEAVVYILEGFIGLSLPRDLIPNEIVFLFRKSGGFNNDWDTCYGVLMFILCNLPEDFQRILGSSIKKTGRNEKPLQRFLQIKSAIEERDLCGVLEKRVIDKLIRELPRFASSLDESGIRSVDRNLRNGESAKDYYEHLRYLLLCPYKVGGGIIPTVFEEIFCGSSLLKEVYGTDPRFYNGCGRIENERLIISSKTLDRLSLIFGKPNFGIASGSRFRTAEKVLGKILRYFKSQALVFLDDIEREEERISVQTGCTANMKKPRAFSLLKSSKGLQPFRAALYVGDSMEDALTEKKALDVDPRFLFAGVYSYSGAKNASLKSFLQAGVDVILPSVNEIPLLLEKLRR